jgi:hypothetical protein
MRGWITGEESYTPAPVAGTVILKVTGGGTRWTVISIETPQEETPREFYANQKVTYTAPNGDKHSAIILEWRESMHHYTITLCDTRRVVSAHETHLTARQS